MFKIKRVAEPKFAQGHRYELWQFHSGQWICRADKEPSLFAAELTMQRFIPESERYYDDKGRLIDDHLRHNADPHPG